MKNLATLLVLCLVMSLAAPTSAWTGDDAPDWDARILRALDDAATWGMVLSQIDAWPADTWGMVNTVDIPPISPATRQVIRDRLAIDNRIPDNRFSHMPHASEGWAIHLIVDAVITIILIAVGYVVSPYISSWLAAREIEASARTAIDIARQAGTHRSALYTWDVADAIDQATRVLTVAGTTKHQQWEMLTYAWGHARAAAWQSGDAALLEQAEMWLKDAAAHAGL